MRKHFTKTLLLYFGLLILGISGFFFTILLPHPQGAYAFIVVAALGGFGVSATIWRTKQKKEQLVCPTGSDCNAVVNSRFAKFFGVPLEFLGVFYFACIALAYLCLLLLPQLIAGPWLVGLLMLSTAAFFFSSYLLFVQAFLLRQWCIWCILAAMFSLTIFFMSLSSLEQTVTFLANMQDVFGFVQTLGFVLGMGGSTAAVFLFSKFLRDTDIDAKEADALKGISEMIWLGLGLLVMSHFALSAGNIEIVAQSGAFLARMVALFGAALSGAILLIMFAPFLAYLPFSKGIEKQPVSFLHIRKAVFITGAVALASWYFAFATYYLPPFGFFLLLAGYAAFLAVAVITSLAWEQAIAKRKVS